MIISISVTSLIAAYITHLLFRSDNDSSGKRRGFRAILQCFNLNRTGRSDVHCNIFFKLHIKITRILSTIHLMAASSFNHSSRHDIIREGVKGEGGREGMGCDMW